MERMHMQSSRLNRQSLGIPDEKGRYVIQRELVIEKVNTLLLPLMRKHDIDMWITLDRECNPDPFAAEIGGQGRRAQRSHLLRQRVSTRKNLHLFASAARGPRAATLR